MTEIYDICIDGQQGTSSMRSNYLADRRLPIEQRMTNRSIPEPNTGCELWLGSTSLGYGTIMHQGKTYGAHRLAWMLGKGAIPAGLYVCHRCDTRSCVNPDHLFLGTHADNMKDAVKKDRMSHTGRPKKMTAEMVSELLRLRASGSSYGQLAKQFNLATRNVAMIVQRKAWPNVTTPFVYVNTWTKYTQEQVLEVFKLRASGLLHREIAELTGISLTSIVNILAGRQGKRVLGREA